MLREPRSGTAKDDPLAPELEELLALTAHELHEPLRKITAFGGLLRTRAGPKLDEECLDYLDRIERAGDRMRSTLGRVIAYARAARGLPLVRIDLEEAAAGAVEKLREAIEESGAVVEISKLPAIDGDPFQMQQLFELLLENAVKFRRPEAELRILIDAVSPEEAPGWCKVRVSDNGEGFDDAYAERIFRPFERLHPRGKHSGAGMGLAICQKIAERHGGRMEASGSPGAGAVVTLHVPAPQDRPRQSAEDPGR